MTSYNKGALILGGLAVVSGFVYEQYAKLATGVPSMDRFAIRSRALIYGSMNGISPKVAMAVIWNETKGDPAQYAGDLNSSYGPSIGPMQVSRATATDLGLWNPPTDGSDESQAFLAMSQDEDWGIQNGIKVLRAKLSEADGSILNAVGLYNGSLDNPNVMTYQNRIKAFLSDTYGESIS